MKKIIVAALCFLFIFACKKKEDPEPFLFLSTSSLSTQLDGDTIAIEIRANGPWTASASYTEEEEGASSTIGLGTSALSEGLGTSALSVGLGTAALTSKAAAASTSNGTAAPTSRTTAALTSKAAAASLGISPYQGDGDATVTLTIPEQRHNGRYTVTFQGSGTLAPLTATLVITQEGIYVRLFKSQVESEQSAKGNICLDAVAYYTKDPEGNQLEVSGLIAYPANLNDIKGVICFPNYTILDDASCATTSMDASGTVLAKYGYVTFIPDYIGFGLSSHVPHPYLHRQLTAQTCVDMIYAGHEYFRRKGVTLPKNLKIVGYSQGGYSALALQRELEANHSSAFTVDKVYAGSGPHHISAIFDDYRKTDWTGYNCSVPNVMLGLDYGSRLHCDFSRVFKPFLLEKYQEWFFSKKYTSDEVNAFLIENDEANDALSHYIVDDMFTYGMNSEFNKIYDACKANDNLDWTPKAPILMVHSKDDTYVPYFNSLDAYNAFTERGADVTLATYAYIDHMATALVFLALVLLEL